MVRVVLLLMCISMVSLAGESEQQGWYWYEHNHTLNEAQTLPGAAPMTQEQAIQSLEAFQQKLEAQKALAIMNPTTDNISDYIRLQNEMSQRSTTFATVWQRTLQIHPELDYRHVSPTNQSARRVYYDEQRTSLGDNIKSFTNEYGLLFFFKSDCPFCHKFAPILKMFEAEYGVEVMPISLDGPGLPEYPHPKHDNGIATNLQITTVPAVLAVNPKTNEIIPVSYGLVSVDELSARINSIQSGSDLQ